MLSNTILYKFKIEAFTLRNFSRLAFGVVSVLAALSTPLVEFGFIENPTTKIVVYSILVISVLGSSGPAILYNLPRRIRVRNSRLLMTKVLDMSCYAMALTTNHKFRACVFMLPERNSKTIGIKYFSSNMLNAQDLGIKLERWQGCTGQAWGYRNTVVADLTLPEVQGGAAWGLTEDQLRNTRFLAAILSVPIYHPDNENEIIGIFSLDTEAAIADVLKRDDVQSVAEECAVTVGALLCGVNDIIPL